MVKQLGGVNNRPLPTRLQFSVSSPCSQQQDPVSCQPIPDRVVIMKKIPQPDELSSETPALGNDGAPMLPGTETPRSLGDMLRDAELALENDAGQPHAGSHAGSPAQGSAPRKVKKVSRSQSRRHARERALQALYQWDVSQAQASDIKKQFLDDQDMSRVDVDFFVKLFTGVSHSPQALDDALAESLDRPITDLDPIERAVLRICTYELTQCLDIPARVIINEGIEITKRFGADKGHRYINGVLDKLASEVRPLEMKRR